MTDDKSKIQNPVDTLALREVLSNLVPSIEPYYQTVASQLVPKLKKIRELQGQTTDENQLRRLWNNEKFLLQVVALVDAQREALLFCDRQFTAIDEGYWDATIDYAKLREERNFLKKLSQDLLSQKWKHDQQFINRFRGTVTA